MVRRARAAAAALVGCALAAGCAQRMGERASQGVATNLRENLRQIAADQGKPDVPPMSVLSGNMVTGALDALEDPKQMERLTDITTKVASVAAASAVESAMREMQALLSSTAAARSGAVEEISAQAMRAAEAQVVAALGPRGTGPLARSLEAMTERIAATAARSATANLIPGCDPRTSPGCVDRRLAELLETAGSGMTRGVRGELRWAALAATFGAGFIFALLLALAWQLASMRRELRQGRTVTVVRPPVAQE